MQFINTIITRVFDLFLLPFEGLSPVWGLLVVSVLTGVVMVVIFKYTSNQAAIRQTKDKISAYFMEVRLFKDDLGLMLDAQKRILRTNLTYMKYSVMPMLVMIIPVVLILVQLGIRYASRPLNVGENTIVKLMFADGVDVDGLPVSVETGDGLRMETPLIRIPGSGEIDFRIGAVTEGDHQLSIMVGEERISKTMSVTRRVRRVYPSMAKPTFMSVLLSPGQPPLPRSSIVNEIQVNFPPQTTKVFGFSINWLVFFFIVSVIAGYSLKGVFGVEV